MVGPDIADTDDVSVIGGGCPGRRRADGALRAATTPRRSIRDATARRRPGHLLDDRHELWRPLDRSAQCPPDRAVRDPALVRRGRVAAAGRRAERAPGLPAWPI